MRTRTHHISPALWGALVALALCIGGFIYLYLEHTATVEMLTEERNEWHAAYGTSTAQLAATEEELETREAELAMLERRLQDTEEDLRQEQRQNDVFREQISDLTGTVSTLDRLAQLDKELLQKYSRVYFLNENYRPDRMTKVPDRWVLEGREEQYFLSDAWPFLQDMLRAADRNGIDLRVLSAFRSFDEQTELKGQFTQQYGAGANTFSADQGYSEHQLGTAVDIVDPATGATSQSFAQTDAYAWLQDNAHRYGFILSYPPDNDYYIFEPWHWRFVGRSLASDLHRSGDYFYDWEQRRINEYLIEIFE